MVWMMGFVLALAGAAGVFYCLGLVAWQYFGKVTADSWIPLPATLAFGDRAALQGDRLSTILPYLPQFQSVPQDLAWILERLHIGVIPALAGVILIALGARLALRQNTISLVEERREEDRLRRVRLRQYGDMPERMEPFIGAGPLPRAQDKEAA